MPSPFQGDLLRRTAEAGFNLDVCALGQEILNYRQSLFFPILLDREKESGVKCPLGVRRRHLEERRPYANLVYAELEVTKLQGVYGGWSRRKRVCLEWGGCVWNASIRKRVRVDLTEENL